MKDRCKSAVLALLAAALACTARDQASMLVSVDWLSGRLQDTSLVILHVGSQADYQEGHIPGARLVTLADLSITGDGGLRLELPPVAILQDTLGRLGISDTTYIIVYAATASVQSATRVWFTLDYVGLGARASLLDGGLGSWRAQGRPVSTETPQVEAAAFTPRPRPELVVDAGWVKSHLRDDGVALLDARALEFYTGADAGRMPRAGHIPGARNLPFTSVLDTGGKLLPVESLRELLRERGAAPGKLMVSYCHIGQQATVLSFVARHLGLDARLYDGSFQDWSAHLDLPVERQ